MAMLPLLYTVGSQAFSALLAFRVVIRATFNLYWAQLQSLFLCFFCHHMFLGLTPLSLSLSLHRYDRKPSVLLLDEPTAGMDLPSISALCETLELVKETSAVLVVSHDTEMLSQIADDVWQMKSGGILVAQD